MCKKYLFILILFSTSYSSFAKVYFGFDLGNQSIDSVIDSLYRDDADFTEVSPNEKTLLPLIVIHEAPSLEYLGNLKEGLLLFNQDNILYGIDLTYFDEENTINELKSTLDRKYLPVKSKDNNETIKIYQYKDKTDPTLEIELIQDSSQLLQGKTVRIKFYNNEKFAKLEALE